MAIVKCPECGNQVSDKAKTCIHCGCPLSSANSNLVRIAIEQHPQILGCVVGIYEFIGTKYITTGYSGSVVEFQIEKTTRIAFGKNQLSFFDVSPGKKYKAVWGMGLFFPTIVSCFEVDIIDS